MKPAKPWGGDVLVGAAMPQALEKLVGQFDWVQRSVLFICVGQ
jgi:hypothetical protein